MTMGVSYEVASGGYNVLLGARFIGRVKRIRQSYDHSNGRTYRSWSWAAFPILSHGTLQHRSRRKATAWLIDHVNGEDVGKT